MIITYIGCWRTWHGGHRPTIVCDTVINPLLARPFTPLSYGEGESRVSGAGEGLQLGGGASSVYLYNFTILLFRCVFWKAPNHNLKAWVSGCKTKGFRVWKHGFQDVKAWVLQMRSINFENCKQTAFICLQIVRKRDNIMLTNVKYADCINIHFRPHFCIFIQKCPRVVFHFAASCERPPCL